MAGGVTANGIALAPNISQLSWDRRISMIRVVVGVLAGGLAVWLWGEKLRRYSNTKSREVRAKAADTLQIVEKKTGDVLNRAKEQVSSTLHAGQEAIRPRVN